MGEGFALEDPSVHQPVHAFPGRPGSLAPAPQGEVPGADYLGAEVAEAFDVRGHGMICEISTDDALEPSPLNGHRQVTPFVEDFAYRFELRSHPLLRGASEQQELPALDFPQMCVKPRKSKVCGFPSRVRGGSPRHVCRNETTGSSRVDGAPQGSLDPRVGGMTGLGYLRDLFCLLSSRPRNRVLELAPASWQQTLQKEKAQQRLAANVARRIGLGEHAGIA
ncbi:hypothetical protein [Nannocystis pusilla]|uniref:hypothetical protein n=1 Tax=Nannocystis pusilla TaxID=889268 RepID=UPI003B76E516